MGLFKEPSKEIFSKSHPRKKTFQRQNAPSLTINPCLSNLDSRPEPGSGQGVHSIDSKSQTKGQGRFQTINSAFKSSVSLKNTFVPLKVTLFPNMFYRVSALRIIRGVSSFLGVKFSGTPCSIKCSCQFPLPVA